MFQTLARVNAAIARIQPELPSTAKITAERLTFAAFPIMGYSLTSDSVHADPAVGTGHLRLKPRLNRMNGVSTVVVQGDRSEFEVRPDPAKLLQTQITVPNLLDAIGRSNLIDSPGLYEAKHQLVLSLVSGQARSEEELSQIVVKTTPLGAPIRIGDVAAVAPSTRPMYVAVTANAKPAVLLNVFRQPDSNTATVADAVHAEIDQIRRQLPKGVDLQPFYDQSDLVNDSIRACATRYWSVCAGVADHGALSARLGHIARRGARDSATLAITFIALRALGESFN
jgi:multidrug efflux pump subunit AcrB